MGAFDEIPLISAEAGNCIAIYGIKASVNRGGVVASRGLISGAKALEMVQVTL
jgi:hypothetical protein